MNNQQSSARRGTAFTSSAAMTTTTTTTTTQKDNVHYPLVTFNHEAELNVKVPIPILSIHKCLLEVPSPSNTESSLGRTAHKVFSSSSSSSMTGAPFTAPFTVPLKNHGYEDEDDGDGKWNKNNSDDPAPPLLPRHHHHNQDLNNIKTSSSSSGMVCFDKIVSVILIPNRNDYPSNWKQDIWSNKRELQKNATRNLLEFAAEGYDWRTVTEESNMIQNQDDGTYIHPIHYSHTTTNNNNISIFSNNKRSCQLQQQVPPVHVTTPSSSSSSSYCSPDSGSSNGYHSPLLLIKPKPQRPRHPSLICDHMNDDLQEMSDLLHDDDEWDPITRPITPTPFYTE